MGTMKKSILTHRLRATAGWGACAGLLAASLPQAALADQDAYMPVTTTQLNNAGSDDGWLMFNRDYTGRDYAPFTRITPANVSRLSVGWTSGKIDIPNGFEDTPIVNGDYMFVTTPKDRVIAYNAATGAKLWEHDDPVPPTAYKALCCDTNNRGVALFDHLVIFGAYDGVNTPVLTGLSDQGASYKAIVEANRNGYFYAIDRTTGKLIYAKPFVHDISIKGIVDGETVTNDAVRPALGKTIYTCPRFLGGKNWWPTAVDPKTNMAYVPTLHACTTMTGVPVMYAAGLPFLGETFRMLPDPATPGSLGSFQAIDLSTGQKVWEHKSADPWDADALATASGVVFSGTPGGHLLAFDAATGKVLWTSPQPEKSANRSAQHAAFELEYRCPLPEIGAKQRCRARFQ